ncbi:MAG: hypothetical protein JST40_13245 [Armatimonadetes bacterium]|nr:hypothetical protein [Armatimonadota bacterium]
MSKKRILRDLPESGNVFAALETIPDNFPSIRTAERSGYSRQIEKLKQLQEEAKVRGYKEGYQVGYEEGTKQGRLDGVAAVQMELRDRLEEELSRLGSQLQSLGNEVETGLNSWFTQTSEALAGLSIAIAEKVIAKEVESDPDSIVEMAKEALLDVTHASSARILVGTAGYDILVKHQDALLSHAPSLRTLELIADPHMGPGVIVDTDGGRVDARVSVKLETVETTFEEAA